MSRYYPLNITEEPIPGSTKNLAENNIYGEIQEFYPLSPAQKSIFLAEQRGNTDTIYNNPFILSIEGELDITRLSKAIHSIFERHEILKTSFGIADGIPVQKVNKNVKLKKTLKKCSEDTVDFIIEDFVKPFNISKAPLFRVELMKISQTVHLLHFDFHSLIFDGFSLELFIEELIKFYREEELPPLKFQYKQIALWQENGIKNDNLKEQEAYWTKVFSEELPDRELPFTMPGGDIQNSRKLNFTAEKELTEKIRKISSEKDTEIFIILYSVFNILLSRYTSQEDIVTGIPVIGRRYEEFKENIGHFINILPVRNYPSGNKTFLDFLSETKENVIKAYENQDYHVEELIEKLNLKRKTGRNPLFDIVFIKEKIHRDNINIEELNIKIMIEDRENNKFPLSMSVNENDEIGFHIEYATSLYKEESIKRMTSHFLNILEYITENPDCLIKEIAIMKKEERDKVIYEFNKTEQIYPKEKTIIEVFEEQVERTPENIAVVYKDEQLTYRELNEKSNQIGRYLRKKGVKPDDIVGILVGPSLYMITGVLGILKSGAGYMPIDPKFPGERINYMFQNSNSSILLSQKHLFDKMDNFEGEFIDLEDENIYKEEGHNPEIVTKPHNIAYVIYTSGSTGKPKGTMIEQNSLVNFSLWQRDSLNLTSHDRMSKYAGFSFDVSVGEIFPTLITGASIYIICDEIRLSPSELNDYFEENGITVAFLPTQFCEQFMDIADNKSLRVMDVAGEKLKHFKKRNYKLLNKYGPTEYTVYTTIFEVEKYQNNIPIGKPIANTKIYIMDKYNNIQPVEIPGELYISGEGIARGYVNRPDLTAEKFIDNIFEPGKKMYRTGDLARWLPDGNIEFLGRIDHQVKIRGFRIELQEIEHIILQDKDINQAVVIDRDDEHGNKYLCGYIVGEGDIDITEVRKRLSKDLPDYMIPQYILQIDSLPLNPNGKLDRKALPEPDKTIEPFVACRNDDERKIRDLWEEVLGVKNIGINDNFFSLGGHSLKAVRVVSKLQTEFELTVNDIFKYQTIGQLSENIKRRKDFLKIKLHKLKERYSEKKDRDEEYEKSLEDYKKDIHKYEKLDLGEKKNYRSILLTGSTGYLGIYLLMDLLKETEKEIYLIIRGESREHAKERLGKKLEYYFRENIDKYNARLHIFNGDLSMENLGLEEEIYNELSEKVDCIIHPAADVRHFGHYDNFVKNNITATKNLLTLAGRGVKKDFNHISTISIAEGKIEGKTRAIFTEKDLDMGQKIENYYGKTKLEAEKLVVEARKEGIITNIYRIGNILYNSETGHFQENFDDNAFYTLLKSYLNIGVIPQDDEVDFTYVNHASKAILSLYNEKKLFNETYHIINPSNENMSGVLSSLGLDMDILPTVKFIDYLYKSYDNPLFKLHIENIMLHKGWMSEDEINLELVSHKTQFLLEKVGFEWPFFDPSKLKHMIALAFSDRISVLEEMPLFENMTREDLAAFAGIGREEFYEEESYIQWEGDINKNLYIIIEGHVEIMKHTRAGWPGTICIVGEKDFFGEGNIWEEGISSITAEVFMGDAKVLSVKGEFLLRFIKDYPHLGVNLIREISKRMKKYEKLIVEMA